MRGTLSLMADGGVIQPSGPAEGVTYVRSSQADETAVERRLSAPGWRFNGTAIFLFVIALWRGSERGGDLGSVLLVATAWFVLLLAWLFWVAAAEGSGNISTGHLLRWILAPSLFVLAAALVFGGYALDARFRFSQGSLEAAADAAVAGEAVEPGWIGLYPVEGVSVQGTSVRFSIPGQSQLVRGTWTQRGGRWRERLRADWWYEGDVNDRFMD